VRRLLAVGLAASLAWVLCGSASAGRLVVLPGQAMPDLEFEALLDTADYASLGLTRNEGPVRLSQIPGEVLILEFFNKACLPCQRQVRYLQEYYREIQEGNLAGRVRVLAIAAGNQPKYLGKFRASRGLTYPITADPQFDQWRRLGEPGRTPFTVFLLKREGVWVLASSYYGIQLGNEFSAHTGAVLRGEMESRDLGAAEVPEGRPYVLPADAEGVKAAARRLFRRVARDEKVDAELLTLAEGQQLYRATRGGRPLDIFARLASREPVCEVCHAVHFLFAFDDTGRLLGFEPIHVTKYGNEEWDHEDSQFFERRLEGRSMKGLSFDPEMDAVSRATMSSALIFDEIRRSAELVKLLPRP
jgi:peroxiredoxin